MALVFNKGFSFSGFERDGLFMNVEGHKFKDISGISGLDSLLDGRAIVVADFDNDGDEDFFMTTIQEHGHQLYRNNVGQANPWIRVSLEGTRSGRDAFGTIVRLKTSNGLQTRIKSGGNGFLSQPDPRLLFGLGEKGQAEWLEVSWPSGLTQRFPAPPAGSFVHIREGDETFGQMKSRTFSLPDPLSSEELQWRSLRMNKGESLPELSLRVLAEDGSSQPATLEKGRSYLVNFWATWCGPCRKEMPELERLRPDFQRNGIQLLGISVDQDLEDAEVLAFARQLGVTYPILRLDPQEFAKLFSTDKVAVPLSIVVDENGRATQVFSGWSAKSESRVKALLK